ncbi:ECF transporter S component [Enterococcus sp. CWB-B31]|uniref:ECF transporter S component n=1 Tax=Enterococcus sp. CWB-B31 TaxID=2885159 RepID=UPI001E42F257|nr:ECF transporter S component [Enterococcus sp. CWB-B31]MCB5954368.1 ECF transporter S component [Enterococcus sp. CWB-B31]
MAKKNTTLSLVLVALFTALTIVGTMIKIPLPTGAFVHLGNAVLLLAVLLLGYTRGALAGGLGFAIFDLMNGFAAEAPYFIIESFIVGGAAAIAMMAFHNNIDNIKKLMTVAIVTGIAKIIMTQLKNTALALFAGSSFQLAFSSALSMLLATVLNVTITIIFVSLVYFPLKKAMTTIFR